MSPLITDPEEITPDWLTEVLRRSGCLPQGEVVDVGIATESSFTSAMVRLALSYSQDAPSTAPSRLFLNLSRLDSKQRVVGSEQRRAEVAFHNRVVTTMPHPPVVHCYQAIYCGSTGASHLLFDDVSETHFGGDRSLPASRSHCEKAMESFADFHAFWWDHSALSRVADLPNVDSVEEYVASVRKQFPRFADAFGDRLSAQERQLYERVLARLPTLWQRVTQRKHLTLIHGDANFTNVLLPYDPETERALIIDWQLWNISFGAEDLSHLIALFWDKDHRHDMERALLVRYHERLLEGGVRKYEWTDCWYDYRLAVIVRVLFMPMWFWTAGSSPVWCSSRLANAMQAFADLGCSELLDG